MPKTSDGGLKNGNKKSGPMAHRLNTTAFFYLYTRLFKKNQQLWQ
jgi:hypothetical protein